MSPTIKPQIREIQYNGARLTYTQMGNQSFRPLCFLPGWCGDRSFWREQSAYFAEEYFVLAIDFPGFGQSSLHTANTRFSLEYLADFIVAVLRQEALSNCTMVAHSAGGALALTTAALNPSLVRAVIGVDAFTYMDFYPQVDEEIIEVIIAPLLNDFNNEIRVLASSYFLESSDPVLRADIVETMAGAKAGLAVPILKSFLRWDMLDYLNRFSGPVSAISAQASYDEQAFLKVCGDRIDVRTIGDTGHFVMLERPDELNRVLRQLL